MAARIIDGKSQSASGRAALALEITAFARDYRPPGLAVVIVGSDPASQIYVRSKVRLSREVGMRSFEHALPESISQDELLSLICSLNHDHAVDGILVQLPLPSHIDSERVLKSIDPTKDVDGFHPINVGLVATGGGGLVPCTPLGSLMLLKSEQSDLSGLNAVIVGRSNIVGKPMAQLLLLENCTVTIAHSRTRDLPAVVRQGDIVIAAAGQPELIRGSWLKPGALVIDVGINRIALADGSSKLVGDVAQSESMDHVRAISPVPGGVGPMTIFCLLKNTLDAAVARRRQANTVGA